MECPVCPGAALKSETAGALTIDRCPSCRGIWLDALELEQLLREPPQGLIQDDQRFSSVAGQPGARRNCPSCGGTAQLIKLNSLGRPGTILDSCTVCYGTWLDAGELARLTGQELEVSLQAMFVG
jgi:Zn-finger nucleic acid-binding protein